MRNYFSSGNRENPLREIFGMNSFRVGRLIMRAPELSAAALEVAVSLAKAQKNRIKLLVGLVAAISFWSLPALAQERQERNEVGLQIGGIVTPSQTLSRGVSLIGPGGAVLPNRDIAFDSSLTLGAEYDRTFVLKQKFAIDPGVDFLASPLDVKLSQKSENQRPRQLRIDRKSTRLNSSHANISYAVFCLKKKNNTRRTYAPPDQQNGDKHENQQSTPVGLKPTKIFCATAEIEYRAQITLPSFGHHRGRYV